MILWLIQGQDQDEDQDEDQDQDQEEDQEALASGRPQAGPDYTHIETNATGIGKHLNWVGACPGALK